MKQAIIGFGFFMITIFTIMTVMALSKENTEQNLLEQSVEVAIYQSLKEGMELGIDPGELFEVNLSLLVDVDTIYITIEESDESLGILSVTVNKYYDNFGEERMIQVNRTVIYEQEVWEEEEIL